MINNQRINFSSFCQNLKKDIGRIGICIDSSTMFSKDDLDYFLEEMRRLSQDRNSDICLITTDSEICEFIEIKPGDPTEKLKNLEISGRGGLIYQIGIDKAEESGCEIIFYFTDLCGVMPRQPNIDLYWVVPESVNYFSRTNIGTILVINS